MKPVVTYKFMVVPPRVNEVALIAGLTGHPRQGTPALDGELVARTSRVVRVQLEQGTCGDKVVEFETENTRYRPESA